MESEEESVHLSIFPSVNEAHIDEALEYRMDRAQRISSLVLALRKKLKIKVRQPLQRIMVPVLSNEEEKQISAVSDLILNEVNVKELQFVRESDGLFTKTIKANFKALGRKLGPRMKLLKEALETFTQEDIAELEGNGTINVQLKGGNYDLVREDVIVQSADIPGWQVNSDSGVTVALDDTLTEELLSEGHAREIINRLQKLRKDKDFEITDKIRVQLLVPEELQSSIQTYKEYICSETLCEELALVENIENSVKLSINNYEIQATVLITN